MILVRFALSKQPSYVCIEEVCEFLRDIQGWSSRAKFVLTQCAFRNTYVFCDLLLCEAPLLSGRNEVCSH